MKREICPFPNEVQKTTSHEYEISATWIETGILYFGLFFCGAITGASLLIYDRIGKTCGKSICQNFISQTFSWNL